MLSDKFCGPRDAVRGQLNGVVELPSTPTVKFVDQVRKMVETASDYNDVALALKAAVAVDPAAFPSSGGRRGEGARRFRAGARERLDQGPGRPRRFYRIGRRPGPAVGTDERGRGFASSGAVPARARRAAGAVSLEGRLRL